MRLMEEVGDEVGRKKEVSRRVKELKAQISAFDHEATQLAATQQHLKRQQASLVERIQRLEHQVGRGWGCGWGWGWDCSCARAPPERMPQCPARPPNAPAAPARPQGALKIDAAESYVEQQLKDKEAVEAENAAMDARLSENEAQVRACRRRSLPWAPASTHYCCWRHAAPEPGPDLPTSPPPPPPPPLPQIRSLADRMRELQSSHDAQVGHVLDKYASLRKAVGEYNGTLLQALGSSRQQGLALEAVDLNAMMVE
jgi:hypothetical protein